MLQTIKNRIIGTAVVAMVLGLGFYFLNPGMKGRERDHNVATLLVTFDPPKRNKSILIFVRINGKEVYSAQDKESPWQDNIPVPTGAQVSFTAIQGDAGKMECTLTISGKKSGPHPAPPIPGGQCMALGVS